MKKLELKYCPSCGRPTFTGAGKHYSCSSCGFEFYFNVAAAVAGIIEYEDAIIVTIRKFDPEQGGLDLPGGFVDPGESVEQALIREVKEELNLEITQLNYLGSTQNKYPFKDVNYLTLDSFFITKVDSIEGIRTDDDVEDFRLIPKAELTPDMFPFQSIKVGIEMYLNM